MDLLIFIKLNLLFHHKNLIIRMPILINNAILALINKIIAYKIFLIVKRNTFSVIYFLIILYHAFKSYISL